MYRNKPSQEARLRAPQYSIGPKFETQTKSRSISKSELAELFADSPGEPAPAPTVVVKRKRHVDVSAVEASNPAGPGGSLPASAADCAEERRPRVFVVKQPDVLEVAAQAAQAVEPGSLPADPALGEAGVAFAFAPAPASAVLAAKPGPTGERKRTPGFKRPGAVIVTRPERVAEPADDDKPPASLSELEAELAAASRTLAELGGGASAWSFDTTINTRWAQVEAALQSLDASLSAGKRRRAKA